MQKNGDLLPKSVILRPLSLTYSGLFKKQILNCESWSYRECELLIVNWEIGFCIVNLPL